MDEIEKTNVEKNKGEKNEIKIKRNGVTNTHKKNKRKNAKKQNQIVGIAEGILEGLIQGIAEVIGDVIWGCS
ncbi:MAG: hypothetical protein LBQ05_03400 [Christensenellaceae bacterium]|nr:hypothetical protein [Christensenellaceae bacterium]